MEVDWARPRLERAAAVERLVGTGEEDLTVQGVVEGERPQLVGHALTTSDRPTIVRCLRCSGRGTNPPLPYSKPANHLVGP